MNDEDLLPCPFCGGDAEYLEASRTMAGVSMIKCHGCGCRMYSGTVEQWNTRKAPEKPKESVKEEFYEEYGIVYKAVPEEVENECTGCAFAHDCPCPGSKGDVVCYHNRIDGPSVIWKEVK